MSASAVTVYDRSAVVARRQRLMARVRKSSILGTIIWKSCTANPAAARRDQAHAGVRRQRVHRRGRRVFGRCPLVAETVGQRSADQNAFPRKIIKQADVKVTKVYKTRV